MSKDQILYYALISFGMVLGGAIFAKAIYAWIEDFMFGRKKDHVPDLEDMVRHKETMLGGTKTSKNTSHISTTTSSSHKDDHLRLEESTDPQEKEKKALIQRIYGFNSKRLPDEAEDQYFCRLLDLPAKYDLESLKKAYKKRSKELHPDLFPLDKFDSKTRKRLKDRVHENYLAVQKAHDTLKKKVS